MNPAGPVIKKRAELVGEAAAFAQPRAKAPFDGAGGAGKVSGDSRAVPADRDAGGVAAG